MSEQVKRYDVCRAALEGVTKMPLGRFVTYDDYAALRAENEALRRERDLIQSAARDTTARAELADNYERWLEDIGKQIGCGHVDEALPSCVGHYLEKMEADATALRAKLEAAEKERERLAAGVESAIDRYLFGGGSFASAAIQLVEQLKSVLRNERTGR